MKRNEYFEIGDVVNMHCGEQGIVVEILDNTWVLLIQSDGHIEKTSVNDIWKTDFVEQNGKEALHELFMKTLGYAGIYDEEEEGISLNNEDDIPF